MKHIKLFESWQETDSKSPGVITVRLNGDFFLDDYYRSIKSPVTYQAKGFSSNLQSLENQFGQGGLNMRKGEYYPLFKIHDIDRRGEGVWIYIVYNGDEIGIVDSVDHSSRGIDISNSFDKLNVNRQWYCKFENGVYPGAIDHRRYFEIISVDQ
jgi:hypothetical protein